LLSVDSQGFCFVFRLSFLLSVLMCFPHVSILSRTCSGISLHFLEGCLLIGGYKLK
jgi:hypothetical protein